MQSIGDLHKKCNYSFPCITEYLAPILTSKDLAWLVIKKPDDNGTVFYQFKSF